jgi:hypothetical protein
VPPQREPGRALGGALERAGRLRIVRGCWPRAQVCTVFAQLTVRGKWEGPHVFVVRIRGDAGEPVPGVRILDNGPKAGLQGEHASLLPC